MGQLQMNVFHYISPKISQLILQRLLLIIGVSFGLGVVADTVYSATLPLAFAHIQKFARLSAAAYQPEQKILAISSLPGATLTRYGRITRLNVVYFLTTLKAEKKQLIAVRGTANIENAFVDVDLQLITNKHTGIRLHRGFAQAAQGIYQQIRPHLKPDYKISTTGHSLGGAVALVLAMLLDRDKLKIEHVVTFGQPKVTNIAGANRFKHLNIARLVTPGDLVPLLPPFDPVDINNLDIYWHLGTEIVLLLDTRYSVLSGLDSMLRATKLLGQSINRENLNHHHMQHYLDLISKKINRATLVPYKNDFNFFGWFGTK